MKNVWIISAVILLSICKVSAQTIISAKDAADHIGEKVTICDKVFRENNKAFKVSLYLGDSTSHFAIVTIRFSSKFRHSIPDDYFHFEGKQICVTGTVLKGPFIKVNDPAQIKIVGRPINLKIQINSGLISRGQIVVIFRKDLQR